MAYLAQKVEDNLDQAFAQRKILQELIDQQNTEQTLFYLLSSRERSYLGLEPDRRYTPAFISDPFSASSYQPSKNTLKQLSGDPTMKTMTTENDKSSTGKPVDTAKEFLSTIND